MSVKVRNYLMFILETAVIVIVTLIGVLPVSCKLTESGVTLLDGDYDFPKLTAFSVEDESSLKLVFSEQVQLVSGSVSVDENVSIDSNIFYDSTKTVVTVELEEKMIIGASYQMLGTVKDLYGNTLTFSIPFLGYNGNVPMVLITEVQSESVSSRTKTEKENDFYRNEYVEFVALSDGNLCGLELVSAYDGNERSYVFPDVNVKSGEVFVVHLRKRGNGCENETGENLSIANTSYTTAGVRDLWSNDEQTALGNKTDVVVLRNSANGKVLDCLVYKESKQETIPDSMINYVDELERQNIINKEEDFCFESDSKTQSTTYIRKGVISLIDSAKKQDFEYPVKFDKSKWTVDKASPGTL